MAGGRPDSPGFRDTGVTRAREMSGASIATPLRGVLSGRPLPSPIGIGEAEADEATEDADDHHADHGKRGRTAAG